jgi:hypothetical protein
VVTPAVIAFHWLDEPCDRVPTLEFDCLLDTFFLLDIVYQFFVGVIDGTQYYDEPKWVAKNYLKNNFIFDMFTSIPVSYVELTIATQCQHAAASGQSGNEAVGSTQLRFIRILKPLRWFKLARVIKINKASAAIDFIVDYFSISPSVHKTLTLCAGILGSIHLAACFAWLTKVLSSSKDDVTEFVKSFETIDAPIDLGTASGKIEAYWISTYFVTTVFSTVGFGDISPQNFAERMMCMLLMLCGIVVFGNLLAELAEINHATRELEVEKLKRVQHAVDFMNEHNVPASTRTQVRRWTRFFLYTYTCTYMCAYTCTYS